MNIKKYLIALSFQLLISWHALDATQNARTYVVGGGTSLLYVVDQITNTQITGSPFSIPFPISRVIIISPDFTKAYIVSYHSDTSFAAIDLKTNTVLYTLDIGGAYAFSGVLSKDGDTAYISQEGSNQIQIVSGLNSNTTPIVGTPVSIENPFGLAISLDGNTLYAASQLYHRIYYYNISGTYQNSPDLIGQISDYTSQIHQPFGLLVDPSGDNLYICNFSNGTLSVADLSSYVPTVKTTSGYPITVGAPGNQPLFMAITPNGDYGYVTSGHETSVSVIDLTYSPAPVQIDSIGVGSQQVGIAASVDNSKIFTAVEFDQTLATIDVPPGYSTSYLSFSGGFLPLGVAVTKAIQPPNPPSNATSEVTKTVDCRSVLIDETFTITWQGSSTSDVVAYNIYDGYTLITTVSADPYATPYTIYTYSLSPDYIGDNLFITAVDDTDSESTPTPVTVLPPTTIVVGNCSITGPTNVVGTRANNVFLLQIARYLTITWTASADAVSYNIYNGTTLVGNVSATSPLTFNAFLTNGDNGSNFFVTAVNSSGTESAPVAVAVA